MQTSNSLLALLARIQSIREGIMKGRILDSDHFDLEDEEPESIDSVGSIDDILPEKNDKIRLHALLCKENKTTIESVDKKSLQII